MSAFVVGWRMLMGLVAIALVLLVLMRSRTSRERAAVHCPGNLRISRNTRIHVFTRNYPHNFFPKTSDRTNTPYPC